MASDNGNDTTITSIGSFPSHSMQSFQTAQSSYSHNGDATQEGLRRRGKGHARTSHEDLSLSKMWILPIFHYERYGTKVKHLPVDSNTSDENLFTMVKERYLEETSRIRRFFALRGVTKISCVKVCHLVPLPPNKLIHLIPSWNLELAKTPLVILTDQRLRNSSFMRPENPTFINSMTGHFQSIHPHGSIRAAQLRRNISLSSVIHTSCTFGRTQVTPICKHTGHGVVGFGGYLNIFARDKISPHRQ